MASKFKIAQDVAKMLKENGLDVALDDINISITLPEIVFQDKDNVVFGKKLIIEVKQCYSKKIIYKDGWEELV